MYRSYHLKEEKEVNTSASGITQSCLKEDDLYMPTKAVLCGTGEIVAWTEKLSKFHFFL